MELKRPVPTGTTSEMANDLQHEAAMRIQARLDADAARQRRLERVKSVKSAFSILLMLGALGGVVWAWRSGLLDSAHERSVTQTPEASPVVDPVPEVKKTSAPAVRKPTVQTVVPAKKNTPSMKVEPVADPKFRAATLAKFANATVDYWKNAVAEDKPGKTRAVSFTGLVPKAAGGFDLLEIEMGGGRFAVKRIDAMGTTEALDRAAFDKLIAKTPYLVMREGRAYFCSAGQVGQKTGFAVPPVGKVFNPSREEFGALADCLAELKVKPPAFRYRVSLVIKSLGKTVPVVTVGFGESVARTAFEQAVGALVADKEMIQTLLAAATVEVVSAK